MSLEDRAKLVNKLLLPSERKAYVYDVWLINIVIYLFASNTPSKFGPFHSGLNVTHTPQS